MFELTDSEAKQALDGAWIVSFHSPRHLWINIAIIVWHYVC